MLVTYIGQSTFKIALNNDTIILTDPWFGLHFLRAVPIAVKFSEIQKCDIMLVSHNHIDHFDKYAVKLAKKLDSTVIGSLKVAARSKRGGVKNCIPLKRSEEIKIGNIKIRAIFAEHPLSADAIGFVVDDGAENFYFSGDTRFSDEIVFDFKEYNVDIAFVQIACAVYFGKPDGMNISSASKLVNTLKPRYVIPMHYQQRGKRANPSELSNYIESSATKLVVLSPGVETAVESRK